MPSPRRSGSSRGIISKKDHENGRRITIAAERSTVDPGNDRSGGSGSGIEHDDPVDFD